LRVSGRRSTLIALASTVVFVVVVALVVSSAPGWPEVKTLFFNGEVFRDSLDVIPKAFLLNIKIFVICELLILPLALLIAVARSMPGPVFFPLRAFAVAYADLFRGIPTILLVYILGFGIPALQLSWLPLDPLGIESELFW
jgi:polar amino acid transport system permease protein